MSSSSTSSSDLSTSVINVGDLEVHAKPHLISFTSNDLIGAKQSIRLVNAEKTDIEWSIKQTPAKLHSITPPRGVLSPDMSIDIAVTLRAPVTKSLTDKLRIESKESASARFRTIDIRIQHQFIALNNSPSPAGTTISPLSRSEMSENDGVSFASLYPIAAAAIIMFMLFSMKDLPAVGYLYSPWVTFALGIVTAWFQFRVFNPRRQ